MTCFCMGPRGNCPCIQRARLTAAAPAPEGAWVQAFTAPFDFITTPMLLPSLKYELRDPQKAMG